MSLEGRVAVVTGAGAGMGRAAAVRLAAEGATVAAIDIDASAVQDAAAEIRDAGGSCHDWAFDISSEEAVDAAFDEIASRLGPAYVLAAAAATLPRGHDPVTAVTGNEFARVVGVNLMGTFYCARDAARQMQAAGKGGRIVLWSSVGAAVAVAGHGSYCATKGAVESLARVMAVELGRDGITVNVIAPGTIDTRMNAAESLEALTRYLPVGRAGTASEVSELVAFLCSGDTGFLTGSVVTVDGGMTAINGLVAAAHDSEASASG